MWSLFTSFVWCQCTVCLVNYTESCAVLSEKLQEKFCYAAKQTLVISGLPAAVYWRDSYYYYHKYIKYGNSQ